MRHVRSAGSRVQPTGPVYYEWKAPGQQLTIKISLDLIERLNADVMKGFWAVPKRGMEVGGILLGRGGGEHDPVVVDDFELVPCEHRRGPSYVLSEADRRRLEKTLKRKSSDAEIVGFFRSHTRLGLYLDEDDYALIRSYFADPRHVFLLVRPHASAPPAAGFFFWEDGHIRRQGTYGQFPFSREEVLKQMGVPERVESVPAGFGTGAAVAFEPLEEPEAAVPAVAAGQAAKSRWTLELPRFRLRIPRIKRPSLKPLRWQGAWTTVLAMLVLGVLEYQILKGGPGASPMPDLRVERSGAHLQVNWNHDAPAVRQAERAVLFISDGGFRKEFQLDSRQLRAGSIAYAPIGNDISFRLELLGAHKTVSESLRFVGPPEAQAANSGPQPPSAHAPKPLPVNQNAPATPVEASTGTPGKPRPSLAAVSEVAAANPPDAKKPPKRRVRRWYDDGL